MQLYVGIKGYWHLNGFKPLLRGVYVIVTAFAVPIARHFALVLPLRGTNAKN